MSTNNVVALRELDTVEQVLDQARAKNLKHVIVCGIDENGDNYFQCNGRASLSDMTWMVFSAENAMHRIMADGTVNEGAFRK